MFRILGGVKRGKKLSGPSGFEFRPTTGRVKSFIFSFFNQEIPEANVLDLFSGTGSFGLEAISRGASNCIFVECNSSAIRLLKKNINACGFFEQVKIMDGDVFSVLKRLGLQQKSFDFILADPPFKESFREKIACTVDQHHVLKSHGVLIIEHQFDDPDSMQHCLKLLRQKRFGHCMISMYGYNVF